MEHHPPKALYHVMRHLASVPVVNHIISHIILQGLPNPLPVALVSQGAMTSPATFPILCPLRSTSALHVFGVSGCPLSNIVLNNISVPPAPSALLAEFLRIHVRSALHVLYVVPRSRSPSAYPLETPPKRFPNACPAVGAHSGSSIPQSSSEVYLMRTGVAAIDLTVTSIPRYASHLPGLLSTPAK